MSGDTITVVVDSRIWLPTKIPRDLGKELRVRFKHHNPDFHKKKRMGFSTWGIDRHITTHDMRESNLGKRLTLPRGGAADFREIATSLGYRVRWIDKRTSSPVEFPRFCVDPEDPGKVLRPYQAEAVAAALKRQQGVIRAPTGSGKTIAALAFIHEAKERAVVIMRDGNLLKQWLEVASGCLGIPKKKIGIVRGGRKYRPGEHLTLALQQSLYAKGSTRLEELLESEPFGAVVIDEVQAVAARTFQEVIGRFPCKYRIGVSADETRRDKKEFLIYDEIGPTIHEIDREELEELGVVHPVTVRVVPTDFRADWYRNAEPGERDFNRLLEEMVEDTARNELLLELLEAVASRGEVPALVFTHRREHARTLETELDVNRGIRSGLLLGGPGADAVRFAEDRDRLLTGDLAVACGTFNAIGQGHNFPVIRSGICGTPISKSNPQFFGQVRGRICRTSEGKTDATLYYLWDNFVFPDQLRVLKAWNGGRVEVLEADQWVGA